MILVPSSPPRRAVELELVRLATLAPSGHNAQPWTFDIGADAIRIRPDFSRRLPAADEGDRELWVGLGAALENLAAGAAARGYHVEVDYLPADEPEPCLRVFLEPTGSRPALPLDQAIPERQSTRRPYDGRAIPLDDLRALERAAGDRDCRLMLLTPPRAMEPLAELVQEAAREVYGDPAYVDELIEWIRFGRGEIEQTRDGLSTDALGLPHLPRWLGERALKALVTPAGEARRAEGAVRSSSAFALFVAERDDPGGWVRLGRAFERVALAATLRGIRHAHVTMACESTKVREEIVRWLGLGEARPLLLLRLGYAPPMPRSKRRPLAEVLSGEPAEAC